MGKKIMNKRPAQEDSGLENLTVGNSEKHLPFSGNLSNKISKMALINAFIY